MTAIDSIRLDLELGLRRLGLPALLGAATLAAALGMHAWTLQLRQTATRLKSAEAPRRSVATTPRLVVADPLDDFTATLARPVDRVAISQALWQGAALAGLQVTRLEFADAPDAAGQFVRSEIQVPARGSATQIRQFAFALLAAHPNLALHRLEWRREAGTTGDALQARLVFVLFVRAGGADDAPSAGVRRAA